MEIEELQQLWHEQDDNNDYNINKKAMNDLIIRKANKTIYITNLSETVLMIIYTGAASLVIFMDHGIQNMFIWLMTGWMYATAAYILGNRIIRIQGSKSFDKSISGDLKHAIAVANYQVNLSFLLRWNSLALGILVILSVWKKQHSVLIIGGLLLLFVVSFFLDNWGGNIYKRRKKELEDLQKELQKQ